MNEKRKITDEEKRQLAKLFKGLIPNDTLDEDDILWIMNEVENGNRDVSFEDFIKAKNDRRKGKIPHYKLSVEPEEPHFCFKCKHQACNADEEPCKSCSEWPHPGYSTMASKWEPKEADAVHLCLECKHQTCKADEEPCKSCNKFPHPGYLTMESKWEPKEEKAEDNHLCKTCKFAENPVFEEPCFSCFKKDNDNTYHQNWEIREEEKESEDICCHNCKHSDKTFDEKPCKGCLLPDCCQPLFFRHQHFEEKETVVNKDNSPYFGPNMIGSVKIKNNINDIFGIDGIKKKIDELSESLVSINAKIDILDQRMHDLRNSQILKDMKYVTQVKAVEKDVLEKLNNIEQVVMKNSIGINTTYEKASAVHDEVCKDEDICKDCNYYGMCSGYKGDMIYCKDFKKKDISSAKEPPKFKVGDIVKVTNDSKNNDFFVCRIKWSEHSKTWNYLISMDLEDISGAFWRTEKWLTKSEDHSEPLFKVGDKVKLKAGTTVYTVLSVTHFMCGNKKVYRYKISHSATTPHYENENRLVKA